jgi:predicted dehydrogenase
MRKIKIAQIGIGHNHADGKMQSVKKFPEVFDIVGYAEWDKNWIEKRGGFGSYANLPRLTVDEILSIKDLDAVLVETDVWNLVPAAQKCIDAGLSVHIDKPAGENYSEFKDLIGEAKRKKLVVQMGYMYRYNTAIMRCIEMVKSGQLGEIFAIDAQMSHLHNAEYREWLKNFIGGDMYIFGSHLIDLIISMLGEPKAVTAFNKQTGFDGVESLDNCSAVMDYGRAFATVTNASCDIGGFESRQLVVRGQKGTVEIKPLEPKPVMTVWNEDKTKITTEFPEVPAKNRYDDMMLDFAAMIRGEKGNPYSYEHELLVQKTTLMASGVKV